MCVKQQQLVGLHECCDVREKIAHIPVLNDTIDDGTKMSYRLRHMYTNSTGVLQYLLGSFLVVSPHSIGTERVVSHHNKLIEVYSACVTVQ